MTSKSDLNCVFCEQTFTDKEALQTHFRKHADPNFKHNKEKSGLQNEGQNLTEKAKDELEMVSCDACEETFATISKAITHKHKVHPDLDAKYFCPWCGKLFTLKHLYNKHLLTNHDSKTLDGIKDFHCDSCDVNFYVPAAMLHHNKFFHRQEFELPTIGQSKKQKFFNSELLIMFYCTFCGEEFNNKVNLFTHMSVDHNDENHSPDEVLRCSLCDAIFYHLDAYEVHLTFHSADDIYTDSNERNNIEITEYTVETVPPIMEKVEDINSQCYAEKLTNAVGIETFLQMSMDTESELPDKKHKKHKKRKKSKKSAITLDEFLNMNKDVFGEGIDFQGIEEVPTRVVTKQFKNKCQPSKSLKLSSSLNVEKLKKQGIVIKKSGMTSTVKKMIPNNKGVPSNTNIAQNKKLSANSQTTNDNSSDVLSMFLNKSNNQIKITKRPTQEKNDSETMEENNTPVALNTDDEFKAYKMQTDDVELNQSLEKCVESVSTNDTGNLSTKHDNQNQQDLENSFNHNIEDTTENINTKDITHNIANTEYQEIQKPNERSFAMPSLKGINQQVSIKPVKQYSEVCDDIGLSQNRSSNTHEKNNTSSSYEDEHEEENIKNKTEISNQSHSTTHNKSLNMLKQLGHITVKSVKQKEDINDNDSDKQETKMCYNPISTDKKNEHVDDNIQQNTCKMLPAPLNTLKHLNELVTVHTGTENSQNNVDGDNGIETDDEQEFSEKQEYDDNSTKKDIKLQDKQKNYPIEKNLSVNLHVRNIKQENKHNFDSTHADVSSNINILNNLKNITAKPLRKNQNILQQKPGFKMPIATHRGMKNVVDNEIEIFNIDDSDSSEEEPRKSQQRISDQVGSSIKKVEHKKTLRMSEDIIKKISGDICIKSISTNSMNEIKEHVERSGSQSSNLNNLNDRLKSNQPTEENTALQKVLKNLRKNVTIKSRTSSQSSTKSQDHSIRDDERAEDEGCNYDSEGLKSTEVPEDNCSDDDSPSERQLDKNVTIQYPSGSDSEDGHEESYFTDPEEEFKDKAFSQTKVIPLRKDLNIKNIIPNRDVSNKSLYKKEETVCSSPKTKADFIIPSHLSKNLTIKSLKQMKNTNQLEDETLNIGEQSLKKDTSTNKPNINLQLAAGNQVNTINKAVTVKTFQSQTVIEEVTTTVTKTIRRVNQTVNQEVDSNQSIGQQQKGNNIKIQNFPKPHVLRPTTPQQKVRNVPTPMRAGTSANNSNQIVPVKQGLTIVRNNAPRMPTSKQIMLSPSYQQKPLKISPQVMNNSFKRPTLEENGPFSCFKKPKESLIPSTETAHDKEKKLGTTKQFVSTSQIKKKFSSATNIVKGNSFVKTTQMNTETSSSHINKTQSVSGVRMMHESSVMKVENKSENNVSKRTLDTIEMLRRQGLLVKKPRMDVNNDSDNSNSSGEMDNLDDDK